jgi:hypothetical protein
MVSEEVGLRGDGTCVQLEADIVVFKNCDSPKSSNEQLVFVMCSVGTQEVSAKSESREQIME